MIVNKHTLWLQQLEGLGYSGPINEQERAWLNDQGVDLNALNEMWYEHLIGEGYTGSLADMLAAFSLTVSGAVTPLVISSATADPQSGQSLPLDIEVDKAGDIDLLLYPTANGAPDNDQFTAGDDGSDTAALGSVVLSVVPEETSPVSTASLPVIDPATALSISLRPVGSTTITTITGVTIDTKAPVLSFGTASAITATTMTLPVTTDTAGQTLTVRFYADAATPTDAAVVAGTGAVASFTIGSPTASSNDFSITGLTAETDYKAYAFQADSFGNDAAPTPIVSGTLSTIAATSFALELQLPLESRSASNVVTHTFAGVDVPDNCIIGFAMQGGATVTESAVTVNGVSIIADQIGTVQRFGNRIYLYKFESTGGTFDVVFTGDSDSANCDLFVVDCGVPFTVNSVNSDDSRNNPWTSTFTVGAGDSIATFVRSQLGTTWGYTLGTEVYAADPGGGGDANVIAIDNGYTAGSQSHTYSSNATRDIKLSIHVSET